MSHAAEEGSLAERHHVTLILRLTLDRRERLIQGEMVDTTDTIHQRFAGVAGLKRAVQDWLNRHVQAEDP
jgi:hypothetical protein